MTPDRLRELYGDTSAPAAAKTIAGLGALSFENLLTGHGPPVRGAADAQVRAAIEQARG